MKKPSIKYIFTETHVIESEDIQITTSNSSLKLNEMIEGLLTKSIPFLIAMSEKVNLKHFYLYPFRMQYYITRTQNKDFKHSKLIILQRDSHGLIHILS